MAVLDPTFLQDRAYVGRRALGGGWRIVCGDQLIVAPDANGAALVLLCDAFATDRVREDLVFAFARWLPRCDFRLSAEFVAGWALRWALMEA
ncbi:hypothetical protein [Solirubrobacter soli]|uniref:hypothetical protein n=1 Tax=Solirubrobacter soli TaxID=363832 RepID=UPI00041ADFB6|nr:hypothetical protein [Solirubrobacter soli]